VLAYLSRYTHRVAISNSRLIAADATGVTFRYKDYRIKGPGRYKTMKIKPGEFIRRLPNGFHRIRHYGLRASGTKAQTIARARELIAAAKPAQVAQKQQAPEAPLGPVHGGAANRHRAGNLADFIEKALDVDQPKPFRFRARASTAAPPP
jgi:Putative transposase